MLTEKRKRFAEEYLINLNATQAAIRAGYSKKTAASIGAENLQNPEIKEYIDGYMAQIQSDLVASVTEILEYLTAVMRGGTLEEIVVIEGQGRGCSAARIIQKAPSCKDRLKAAELLGKRYGLFSDRLDMTAGAVTVVIENDYGD